MLKTGGATLPRPSHNYISEKLATAQQGVVPAVGTMSEYDLYLTVLPAIGKVFASGSPRYTTGFSSYDGYSSRSFDYCGFC